MRSTIGNFFATGGALAICPKVTLFELLWWVRFALDILLEASGATVAGATITINNLDRGTSQTAVSNQEGDYTVPFLPANHGR